MQILKVIIGAILIFFLGWLGFWLDYKLDGYCENIRSYKLLNK